MGYKKNFQPIANGKHTLHKRNLIEYNMLEAKVLTEEYNKEFNTSEIFSILNQIDFFFITIGTPSPFLHVTIDVLKNLFLNETTLHYLCLTSL